MTTRAQIGARIRDARTAARLSQQALADATGIPRGAITDIETGKRNITATELVALAKALSVSVGWIVGEEPAVSVVPPSAVPVAVLRQAWRNGWSDRGRAMRQTVADANSERDAYERAFARYMSDDPSEADKDPYRPLDGPDDPAAAVPNPSA